VAFSPSKNILITSHCFQNDLILLFNDIQPTVKLRCKHAVEIIYQLLISLQIDSTIHKEMDGFRVLSSQYLDMNRKIKG